MLIYHVCVIIRLLVVGCRCELLDVLGAAHQQILEGLEADLWVPANVHVQLILCVYLLIIGLNYMCHRILGRYYHANGILAVRLYNYWKVIKFRTSRKLRCVRMGKEVYSDVCSACAVSRQRL